MSSIERGVSGRAARATIATTGAAAAVTFDTTISHTVVVTAQWSAANVANSCVLEILTVEIQG